MFCFLKWYGQSLIHVVSTVRMHYTVHVYMAALMNYLNSCVFFLEEIIGYHGGSLRDPAS